MTGAPLAPSYPSTAISSHRAVACARRSTGSPPAPWHGRVAPFVLVACTRLRLPVRKRTNEGSRERHGTVRAGAGASAGRARAGHAAYGAGQRAATAARGPAVISGWRLSQ